VAQQSGARALEGLASVGLGRVLLRRELWEEALIAHQEVLSRFREAEDVAAQGLVHLGVGEARRQLGMLPEALESFEQAREVYATAGAPLGEAAAEQGAARVLEQQGEAAVGARYQRAVELTLRVGRAVSDVATREAFFDGRAPLFAEAILTSARGAPEGAALDLATAYARVAGRAGRAAAARRLREYEQALPTRGADLSDEAQMRNRAARQHLAAARDALK
jgi:tetratricopeptide (TPR) repeat protein